MVPGPPVLGSGLVPLTHKLAGPQEGARRQAAGRCAPRLFLPRAPLPPPRAPHYATEPPGQNQQPKAPHTFQTTLTRTGGCTLLNRETAKEIKSEEMFSFRI